MFPEFPDGKKPPTSIDGDWCSKLGRKCSQVLEDLDSIKGDDYAQARWIV